MPRNRLLERIHAINPEVDFWSIRQVESTFDYLSVRAGVLTPPHTLIDRGLMLTVIADGGVGYAATADDSRVSLEKAFLAAKHWARISGRFKLFDVNLFPRSKAQGNYHSAAQKPVEKSRLKTRVELLKEACEALKSDDRIVDCVASFYSGVSKEWYLNSEGADIHQDFKFFMPNLSATAHANGQTQTRTLAGHGIARQCGMELLEEIDFQKSAKRVAEEALELAMAENCPSGEMDLLLAPDQMMLQIHESIGHPLELDRILGDERNYAGTSFVTPDMFGKFQYGSKLLNITYDPGFAGEFASFGFDDEGTPAQKIFLIQDGILKRPLGGTLSQARADLPGVSNARACNWNRPPIDRMANLNLEPGTSAFDEMVSSIKHGVYMKANLSWSIDDSRNKFQFGCEWGRLIENGKLTRVVRNPNYRGISSSFWRNLAAVGNAQTMGVFGTPTCGKGEPNQAVRVGHASPVCLFQNIDVFGGLS